MDLDRKAVLHTAVRTFLEAEASDQLEEFEVVFDDVYDAIDARVNAKLQEDRAEGELGVPFDAGMVTGTIISTACWIGYTLLIAVTKYAAKIRFADALDRAEGELRQRGVDRAMLHRIREVFQGVIEEL
jgi:hypothetical protein